MHENSKSRLSVLSRRAGEHSSSEEWRKKASSFFIDNQFPELLSEARQNWKRHPNYEEVRDLCVDWALERRILHTPGTSWTEAKAQVQKAIGDILRFPAYAANEVAKEELLLFGKFWAFVFYVDDEFDEGSSNQIMKELEKIPANDFEGRARLGKNFEEEFRGQTEEYVRILEGEDPREHTLPSLIAMEIRDELLKALQKRHGVRPEEALQMMAPFREAFFRLFDVRTSEIRQRINVDLEVSEWEYNSLRHYTIAMEPLIELNFLFQDRTNWAGITRLRATTAFTQALDALKLQISYVNDWVSICKELREPNVHNIAIQIMTETIGRKELESMVKARKDHEINAAVNPLMEKTISTVADRCNGLLGNLLVQCGLLHENNPASSIVGHVLTNWVAAHYMYAFEIGRYKETIPFLLAMAKGDRLPDWDIGVSIS